MAVLPSSIVKDRSSLKGREGVGKKTHVSLGEVFFFFFFFFLNQK